MNECMKLESLIISFCSGLFLKDDGSGQLMRI